MSLRRLTTHGSWIRNATFQSMFVGCLAVIHFFTIAISEAEEDDVDSTDAAGKANAATSAQVALMTDDAAYLTQLGLLRGHLMVGYELYQQALPEMSETHMKHPGEELYADLIPAFESRGCEGFADELTDLAHVVSDRDTSEAVAASYEMLSASIGRCEAVAERENRAIVMQVISNLLSNALLEYEIGVVDGAINNVHEYQDAWGFTQVASAYAQLPVFLNDGEGQLIGRRLQRLITSLDPLWPSLNPTRIDDPTVSTLLHRLRAFSSNTTE